MSAEVRAEIDIDAPPAAVWAVLVDLPRYPEWNPFTPKVEGRPEVGTDVVLHVAMKPGKPLLRQVERVTAAEPERELSWGTEMMAGYLLRAERKQYVEARPGGGARYVTYDTFEGPLVPLVMALYRAHIQRGFDETARALKRRAEERARVDRAAKAP